MTDHHILTSSDLQALTHDIDPTPAQSEHADEELQDYIKHCERDYIINTLEQNDWHIVGSANSLGISRKNLWEKMKKHGISETSKI